MIDLSYVRYILFAFPSGLLIYFLMYPDKLLIWKSIIAGLFSWASSALEKSHVGNDIAGHIRDFSRTANQEVEGIMPFRLKIEWVKEMTPEGFIKNGECIVRMHHHRNQAKNFAVATMAYVAKSLVPRIRSHIDKEVSHSIDFTMTKKILVMRRKEESLDYLISDEYKPMTEKHPEIEKYCSVMEFLDDHGQFVRIFLNELLLLERELFSSFPRKKLEEESRAFLEFLDTTLVSREAGEEVPLIFEGENIRVKILMIAKPEKILSADWTNPYEKRVEEAIQKGIKNIYLLGRGMNTFAVKKVASCFEKRDEVMISSSREYNLHYKGKRVKAICVLLKVLGQE